MGERWDDGAAYEAYVGRWSRLLAPKFIEWAKLPPKAAVVDVGCGTGAVSAAALEAGAASVVGLDSSAAFVDRAAAIVAPGTGNARFEVGDAMHLPFNDASFDAAVSGLCLQLVPEPDTMVAEMARVVKPGGHVALFVWDYAGKMEMMRYFWDAAVELDPDGAGPLDEGVKYPICHPTPLSELFKALDLTEVATSHIDEPTVFMDFEDYWAPFLGGQGPAPGYLATRDEDERAKLRDRIRNRLPRSPDGFIHLVARAWAVRGVTSASKERSRRPRNAKVARKASKPRGRKRA